MSHNDNNVNVLLCYKNFNKDCSVSHIGLGVTAAYSAKTLNQHGYKALALPTYGADDLKKYILSKEHSRSPITHVVVMAQWLPTRELAKLAREFTDIRFALNCHSNVGFLQAEPNAIRLVREAIALEQELPNFNAASNNSRLCTALQGMYGSNISFLPNLYYLHQNEPIHRPLYNGGVLRLGAFGSHRVYKNFSTGIAALVQISHELKVQAEIWINAGRHDGAGNVVYKTAKAWTDNVPHVTLKELPWASWQEFKKVVGTMNLLMQNSYTETFNNVTADGICQGVPSVVSDTIEWAPDYWMANTDDSSKVARTGMRLLTDHHAARDGYAHLKAYVSRGIPQWEHFFTRKH